MPTDPTTLGNTDTPALGYPTEFHPRSLLSTFDCSFAHAVIYYPLTVDTIRMNTDTESYCRFTQSSTSLSLILLTVTHIRTQTHSHKHAPTFAHSHSCTHTHTHTHSLTHSLKHSHVTVIYYQCYYTHVHRLKQIPVMFWN